ncbi:polysaccharide deacetylase family protein [Agarivorans sp. MS3-6]|uniref:polysaccharide deacetylase family protein n=1 Tax=Agarivorans sp. TSD2052 TaxID=2937286 RepID=UPI00200D310E|nr:polysaccharide deacetylase family protein [Agarivorans sp. TSD2052]UPW19198.1 polysaccharide deacetylase family protein [Agarivorans sp. TSD2052]
MLNKIKYLIRDKVLPDRWFLIKKSSPKAALYLTFDDGPYPEFTTSLLALLAKYNAKATFFVLGARAEKFVDLTTQIVQEGHVLANHSYNHPRFDQIAITERNQQIELTNHAIKQLTNQNCRLFRSPQGRWDWPLLVYLIRRGITAVHWSRDSLDYQKDPTETLIKRFNDQPVKAGDIILFHDDNDLCIEALAVLIPQWQAQGFELKALES